MKCDPATLYTVVQSPLGPLLLTSDGEALTGLFMIGHLRGPQVADTWKQADDAPPFAAARAQLAGYFAGSLRQFDLPLRASGTLFQTTVWQALREIPYGSTRSYGDLALAIGKPNAARAVGLANGRNPLSIVVPCHRVIGASGALIGYGGGMACKAWLLAHEQGRPLPSTGARQQLALTF